MAAIGLEPELSFAQGICKARHVQQANQHAGTFTIYDVQLT